MRGNLAVVPTSDNENLEQQDPTTKDKDGTESDDEHTSQLVVDPTENGFVLTVHGTEQVTMNRVYLFDGSGPKSLIQDIIDSLGLTDKVKIQK